MYTSKGKYVCEEMGEGVITKLIEISEGDHFNKEKTFKGGSAKCYCL